MQIGHSWKLSLHEWSTGQVSIFPCVFFSKKHVAFQGFSFSAFDTKNVPLSAHLNGKNLSTNSSWDFDGVLDTMDPY